MPTNLNVKNLIWKQIRNFKKLEQALQLFSQSQYYVEVLSAAVRAGVCKFGTSNSWDFCPFLKAELLKFFQAGWFLLVCSSFKPQHRFSVKIRTVLWSGHSRTFQLIPGFHYSVTECVAKDPNLNQSLKQDAEGQPVIKYGWLEYRTWESKLWQH